jgi:RNA polymerase sigma-54 factor
VNSEQRSTLQQKQKQAQGQTLSPQQIQYVKLLQLPTLAFEQRVKSELEENPLLEEDTLWDATELSDSDSTDEHSAESELEEKDQEPSEEWEEYLQNSEATDDVVNQRPAQKEIDRPDPYVMNLLERLEQEVHLMDLDPMDEAIAEQILGSLDDDGYFRRDETAIADRLAFDQGFPVNEHDIERVRQLVMRLEPIGVAAKTLQECLWVQLNEADHDSRLDSPVKLASDIVGNHWPLFEAKHWTTLQEQLGLTQEELTPALERIRACNPKPGSIEGDDSPQWVIQEPDVRIQFYTFGELSQLDVTTRASWLANGVDGAAQIETDEGVFVIKLHPRNAPKLRLSRHYKAMWDQLQDSSSESKSKENEETRAFIKEKIDAATWFMDSIEQRKQTFLRTMTAIVRHQTVYLATGKGLKPMILKDIAEDIGMDISTISRVVKGKSLQTPHHNLQLRDLFTEGIPLKDGGELSSSDVKEKIRAWIQEEDPTAPLGDQTLTDQLNQEGIQIARRTVAKYRELMHIPVARRRKQS